MTPARPAEAPARVPAWVPLLWLGLCHVGCPSRPPPVRAHTDAAPAIAAPAAPVAMYGPPPPTRAATRLRMPPREDTPCSTEADCPGGLCFNAGLDAQYSSAFRDCPDGQAWRAGRRLNTCVRPGCRSDTDCASGERCAEAQMLPFPQRVCLPAACRTHLDCRARRLGQCVAFVVGTRCEHGGWGCSYPGDPCAPHDLERRCPAVAGQIAYCVPREGRFRCVTEAPPMP